MSSPSEYQAPAEDPDVLDRIRILEAEVNAVISDRNKRYIRGYPFPDPLLLGLEDKQRYKRFLEQEKEYLQDLARKRKFDV